MLRRDRSYFVKEQKKKNTQTNKQSKTKKHADSTKNFSETDINMLEFFIDNIFAMLGGYVFQQTVGIHTPMGTNCAPLLADLFL